MPRPKGSTNRITAEVKEQLQNLIDEVVNSIVVDSMTTEQKLKLLQLSLHYVLPKLRSTETTEKKHRDKPKIIGQIEWLRLEKREITFLFNLPFTNASIYW